MDISFVIAIAAVLGTFSHWLKTKWAGEVAGNPIDYLIQHPWNTVAMFGATFAAVGTLIMTGAVDDVTTGTGFWIGFATGYTADNVINKGPRS